MLYISKFHLKKINIYKKWLESTRISRISPKLDLISQQYKYEQDYYIYKNENYNLQIPTNEELEKAKQYQDKIPGYQTTKGEEQFQKDIIVNKPDYPSGNQNEYSKENIEINNSVAIGQDPISGTGAPPPSYEQDN